MRKTTWKDLQGIGLMYLLFALCFTTFLIARGVTALQQLRHRSHVFYFVRPLWADACCHGRP